MHLLRLFLRKLKGNPQSQRPPPIYLLPQDLVDQIVDTIANDPDGGRIQLGPCSLVCSSFRHRSQMHIFHSVVFDSNAFESTEATLRCQTFSYLLQINPRLIDYIREIHLLAPGLGNDVWITDIPNFIEIMSMKSRSPYPLSKLNIEGSPTHRTCNPDALISNITHPFVSPFITSLHLKWIENIPLELFKYTVHLKEFKLYYIEVFALHDDGQTSCPRDPSSLPHIERLEYAKCPDAIARLVGKPWIQQQIVDFSTLRILKMNTDVVKDITESRNIIHQARNSLEELYIGPGSLMMPIEFGWSITLEECSCLRVIDIFMISTGSKTNEAVVTSLVNLVKTVRTSCALKYLRLEIWMGKGPQDGPARCFRMQWDALGQEINRVASGRTMEVALYFKYTEPEYSTPNWEDGVVVPEGDQRSIYVAEYLKSMVNRIVNEKLRVGPNVIISVDYEVEPRSYRVYM